MSNSNTIHLDQSGSIKATKPLPPKTIEALAQSRDNLIRTSVGSGILLILTIAYISALFLKVEQANNILVLLGSGLGYLWGSKSKSDQNS
jgi:hypothetical protein